MIRASGIHDCKDDVRLVLDRRERNRGDHHHHEVEGLRLSANSDRWRGESHTQFAEVDNAFAGARIRRGTISAGYSHVIPSHPMAKKVLNMKRNRAATMPGPLPPILSLATVRLPSRDFGLRTYHDCENYHRE